MNSVFNTLFQKFIPYIIVILFAYLISAIIFIFLPKIGIDFKENSSQSISYKKYDGFYSKIKVTNSKKIKKTMVEKEISLLSRYKLKAVYSTTSNSGWAIIQDTSSKTVILEKDQEFKGYTLTKLFKKYIIFEKDLNEYKLELPKNKDINYKIEKKTSRGNENIIVKNDTIQVKRNFLNAYVKDINKVWKDINIKDLRRNGKIEGFKIQKVSKNSVFEKLGLRKNDIIKSVNGSKIRSYSDAFKIYNAINNIDYLRLEVLRNNEIMELDYEID